MDVTKDINDDNSSNTPFSHVILSDI